MNAKIPKYSMTAVVYTLLSVKPFKIITLVNAIYVYGIDMNLQ